MDFMQGRKTNFAQRSGKEGGNNQHLRSDDGSPAPPRNAVPVEKGLSLQ